MRRNPVDLLRTYLFETIVKLHQWPTNFIIRFTDEISDDPEIYDVAMIVARSEPEARKIFKQEYPGMFIISVEDTDESPGVE